MNFGMRIGSLFFGVVAFAYAMMAVALVVFIGRSVLYPPKMETVQRGYRGTGLALLYNSAQLDTLRADNAIPPSVPYAGSEGDKAGNVYKNVKVLGDVPVGEFTRLMVSMARWVAPSKGCAACHNLNNFADDGLYTKVVARRMLEMTRHINTDWTKHVAETGVTCYTCHRGQLVPPNIWFRDPGPRQSSAGLAQMPAGKNHPSPMGGGSALPFDPLTVFLEGDKDIRVSSPTPLQTGDHHSIKEAEWTYSLMMVFSKSLGVNCDFCHNTRSFYSWAVSPAQRVTAWHGIRMVRDLNTKYLDPLRDTFPVDHRGAAAGDAPKLYCATCHNGVYKPLFGVSMARDYPELGGKAAAPKQLSEKASQPP